MAGICQSHSEGATPNVMASGSSGCEHAGNGHDKWTGCNLRPAGEPQSALRGGVEDFVMIFTATQTETIMGSLYSLTATGSEDEPFVFPSWQLKSGVGIYIWIFMNKHADNKEWEMEQVCRQFSIHHWCLSLQSRRRDCVWCLMETTAVNVTHSAKHKTREADGQVLCSKQDCKQLAVSKTIVYVYNK